MKSLWRIISWGLLLFCLVTPDLGMAKPVCSGSKKQACLRCQKDQGVWEKSKNTCKKNKKMKANSKKPNYKNPEGDPPKPPPMPVPIPRGEDVPDQPGDDL